MFDRRILVLIVETVQESNYMFCHAVLTTLHKYAKAFEKDNASAFSDGPKVVNTTCVEFKISNGCVIQAIVGKETLKQ